MGSQKIHVFIVKPTSGSSVVGHGHRLIRGTLANVEAKLRSEISIEPCSAETAHTMSDVEIEEALA